MVEPIHISLGKENIFGITFHSKQTSLKWQELKHQLREWELFQCHFLDQIIYIYYTPHIICQIIHKIHLAFQL